MTHSDRQPRVPLFASRGPSGTGSRTRGGVLVVVLVVLAILAAVALLWIVSLRPKPVVAPKPVGDPVADQVAREKVAAWFSLFAVQDKPGSLDEAEKALAGLLARPEPALEDLIAGAVIARARDRSGERETQARKLLGEVLEREADNPRAHYVLARMDMLAGNFQSAEQHLRKAIAGEPNDLPTQLGLGQVIEESSPKEAEALYRKVIARGVDNAGSWYVTAIHRMSILMRDLGRDQEFERFLAEFQTIQDRGLVAPKEADFERGNLGNLIAPTPRASDVPVAVKVLSAGAQQTLLPELAGFEHLLPYDLDGDGTIDLVGWGSRGAIAALQAGDKTWRTSVLDTAAIDWLIAADLTPVVDVNSKDARSALDVFAARGKDICLWRVSVDAAGNATWIQDSKPVFVLPATPQSGLAFDFDHEGDLDLAMIGRFGLRILRNDGARSQSAGGAFVDVTLETGAPAMRPFEWLISEDFDGDQDVDLLCGGARDVLLLSNLRAGKFASVTDECLKQFSVTPIRPVCSDLDLDGRPDLWGCGPFSLVYFNQISTVFRPDQSRRIVQAANLRLGPNAPGDPWAGTRPRELLSTDFDGDGLIDTAWLNADVQNEDVLEVQLAAGRLGQVGFELVLSKTKSANLPALADIDGDGVPEALISTVQGVALTHVSVPAHPRLHLALRGAKDNRRGVGAVVEMRAGGQYQRVYWRGEPTALGLGAAEAIDWMRIVWPNGVIQYEIESVAGSRSIQQIEGLIASCPFLYTWDGSNYEFVSDVLGITPLGLPMEPGLLVPPDHDEYVLIRGEQLAPKDGKFDLQITEELREVTYLDRLRLDVIDHPEGTEIFPNELFCFPPFPLPHVHTLREPLSPARALGSDGADWTKAVAAIDNEYAEHFEFAPSQLIGLCAPHFIEVEFDAAKLRDAEKLRLFLTGWFYWTDASVNMASARDPSFKFIPPIFQVPDGKGGWKDCGPPVGFPAGKTKTMVVDVSDMLVRDDPRLRIFSSLRLYWDAIRLGVDRDDAQLQITQLEPASAELWRRGFSEPILDERPEQPARFQWNRIAPTPRWNPHPGLYTKYGETLPLLGAIDDQFVILGSGDALHVQFDASAAPELKPGWRRDYFLFLDGWAKDRDPNTINALHVEPLPFHGMSGYPYTSEERFPHSPEISAWLRKYQTRMAEPWILPGSPAHSNR